MLFVYNLPTLIPLQDIQHQVEGHKALYQNIQSVGQELMQDRRNEVTYVSDILENVGQNWRGLEGVLAQRQQQWEERNRAFLAFDDKVRSSNSWLDGMEDRVSNLKPIARDTETINIQIQQLEVRKNRSKIFENMKYRIRQIIFHMFACFSSISIVKEKNHSSKGLIWSVHLWSNQSLINKQINAIVSNWSKAETLLTYFLIFTTFSPCIKNTKDTSPTSKKSRNWDGTLTSWPGRAPRLWAQLPWGPALLLPLVTVGGSLCQAQGWTRDSKHPTTLTVRWGRSPWPQLYSWLGENELITESIW